MINIKFGFNNSDVLTPLSEGTEIVTGNFLDYIAVSDRNYLISELQNEEKSIDVREVLQDVYANRKVKVYFNNYKNCDASRLQTILNERFVKHDLVQFGVAGVLRDNGLDVQDSNLELPDGNFSVVGIDDDVFEQTRSSLRGGFLSYAQLAQRVKVLEAQVTEGKKLTK